jgi:hypothetical protein
VRSALKSSKVSRFAHENSNDIAERQYIALDEREAGEFRYLGYGQEAREDTPCLAQSWNVPPELPPFSARRLRS